MSTTGKSRRTDAGPRKDLQGLPAAAAAALAAVGIPRRALVLAAVSGGPDSTALLSILAELRAAGRLRLHACTVDHGIRTRAEARGDLAFLQRVCASLGVSLSVMEIEAGALTRRAKDEGRSIEEVAREARRAHLARAAAAVGAAAVALGHTRDDGLETVLMGILRGSDAQGLRGIPARQGIFVRPLLACTRADLLGYLASKGLSFRTDSTNADRSLLRNRVRAELVPVLDRSFPGWRSGLAMLARKSDLAAQAIDSAVCAVPWRRTPRGWSLTVRGFFALPVAVRAASLLKLFDGLPAGGGRAGAPARPRRLPYRFLQPVILADGPPGGGGVLLRGHGVVLRTAGSRIFWEADIVTSGKTSYLMEANRAGRFGVRSTGIVVEVSAALSPSHPRGSRPDAVILEREIARPLVLRSRRKGDRLLLEQGTKTLKALFAEWKVPEGDRWKVPVLADRRGVLAVLGGPAGRGAAVRAAGRSGSRESQRAAVVAVRVVKGRAGSGPLHGRNE